MHIKPRRRTVCRARTSSVCCVHAAQPSSHVRCSVSLTCMSGCMRIPHSMHTMKPRQHTVGCTRTSTLCVCAFTTHNHAHPLVKRALSTRISIIGPGMRRMHNKHAHHEAVLNARSLTLQEARLYNIRTTSCIRTHACYWHWHAVCAHPHAHLYVACTCMRATRAMQHQVGTVQKPVLAHLNGGPVCTQRCHAHYASEHPHASYHWHVAHAQLDAHLHAHPFGMHIGASPDQTLGQEALCLRWSEAHLLHLFQALWHSLKPARSRHAQCD